MIVMEPIVGEEVSAYFVDSHKLWRQYLAHPSQSEADDIHKKVNCVMKKIIAGLETFEGQGFTHGDGHLGNIFVTEEEIDGCKQVKFIDFGLGKKLTTDVAEWGKHQAWDLNRPLGYVEFISDVIHGHGHKPEYMGPKLAADVKLIGGKIRLSGVDVSFAPDADAEKALSHLADGLMVNDAVGFKFSEYAGNWRLPFDEAVASSNTPIATHSNEHLDS